MGTIFKNSKNSKTFGPNRLLIKLSERINLKWSNKYVALSNLIICHTWGNSYKYNKSEISPSTRNDKFELPDRSYSLSDIKDYLQYIIKKHEPMAYNLPLRVNVNK